MPSLFDARGGEGMLTMGKTKRVSPSLMIIKAS